jgi:prevent-host-death family protein
MRSVTIAEAERNLAGVLEAAADGPVVIQHDGREVVLVSAAEFEEAQGLLHKERVRKLQHAMQQASREAAANGFTEDMLPELLKDE